MNHFMGYRICYQILLWHCHVMNFTHHFLLDFLVQFYMPRRVQTIECNLKSIKKYIFISSHNPFFWFCYVSVFMMVEYWCTRKREERIDNVPSEKLCPMWVALIGLPCHRNTKITTYLKDVGSMIYISLEYQWNDIKCNVRKIRFLIHYPNLLLLKVEGMW